VARFRKISSNPCSCHERGRSPGAAPPAGVSNWPTVGTLLLGRESATSLAPAVKLLRVLQEKEIEGRRKRPVRVDVRIIGAPQESGREVRQGRFREDLYLSWQVIPVHLPRLCDGGTTFLPASTFLAEFATVGGRP